MSDDLARPTPLPLIDADTTILRSFGYSDSQIAAMKPERKAREAQAIRDEDARNDQMLREAIASAQEQGNDRQNGGERDRSDAKEAGIGLIDSMRYHRLKTVFSVAFALFLSVAAMYASLKIGLGLGLSETWAAITASVVWAGTIMFIDRD